jgi:L-amino acid N-acyltransferase YncA
MSRASHASIVIRPAGPGEARAVAETHVRADAETYAPIFGSAFRPVGMEASLRRWETALAAGDVLLVAEAEGRLVGFAHASASWMSALYLLAGFKRRGLGLSLLCALCAELRRRGVAEIGFKAVAANADAIAFYTAVGAKVVGRETGGEGEAIWEELRFALGTDAPAAFRGGEGRLSVRDGSADNRD